MLYQATVEDIERSKQWGWRVGYATIAAQAAILVIFSSYSSFLRSVWIKLAFTVVLLVMDVIAGSHLRHNQEALSGSRGRIKNIRGNFSKKAQDSFGESNPKKPWPLNLLVLLSTIFFIFLVWVAKDSAPV